MSAPLWKVGRTEDDRARGYLDPETGLLATRSIEPLRTAAELRDFEDDFVEYRLIGLELDPLHGNFDLTHLAAIHRQLFRDVYEWAGEIRTINVSKGIDALSGAPARFANIESIQDTVAEAHDLLHERSYLRYTTATEFAEGLVAPFNLVNLAHPFREGNGRAQRALWDELARHAGHRIDWNTYSGTAHGDAAMLARVTGDVSSLRSMLLTMVNPAPA